MDSKTLKALWIIIGAMQEVDRDDKQYTSEIKLLDDWYNAHIAAVALGRLGGSKTSRAKRRAAKRNGKKGGRPSKTIHKSNNL
jgi:hypothetical protein